MSRYFMGVEVDVGACRGVLVDEEGGCAASCSVPLLSFSAQKGPNVQDAERAWWGGLCAVTRRLLQLADAAPEEVAALGCSAADPSLAALDDEGRPLGRALLGEAAAQSSAERTGRPRPRLQKEPDFPALLRLLDECEPGLLAEAAQLVTAGAFLTLRLTGEAVIDRHTAGRCGTLYDPQTGDWSPKVRAALCPNARLPRCAWPGEQAGRITAQAAETGLAEGTPVAAGICAAAAGAVAAGLQPGRLILQLDASARLLRLTRRIPAAFLGRPLPGLTPERVLCDVRICDAGALTARLSPEETARMWEEGRTLPPGCDGLIVLPYLRGSGAPFNDAEVSGMIYGLKLTHTYTQLYRAAMEGICYALEQYLLQLGDDATVHRITVAGRGAENELLLQLISDVCAAQVDGCVNNSPAFGAARLAAGAAGFGEAAARWCCTGRTYLPDLERHARYRPYFDAFRALYDASYEVAQRDLNNYMYL